MRATGSAVAATLRCARRTGPETGPTHQPEVIDAD